jgi:alpha-tubulin suppressor-like RCC1 family protein
MGQATAPTGSFLQVAAGEGHSCGIRTNGSVHCWGGGSAMDMAERWAEAFAVHGLL